MIVTAEKVQGYAHCRNPVCPGYGQERLEIVRTETAYTYGDNGADMFQNFVERSVRDLAFVDEEQAACRSCGERRELSEQPRPSYEPLSGHDPMGLVNGTVRAFDPNVVNTEADARVAALEAQVNRLEALLSPGEPD